MLKRKGIINTEGSQKRQIGRHDKDEDPPEKERKHVSSNRRMEDENVQR